MEDAETFRRIEEIDKNPSIGMSEEAFKKHLKKKGIEID